MVHMQTQLNNTNKNDGNDNNTSGGNKSNKVPFWKQFYCYTHVASNNQGGSCISKSERHKDNVAFNKQLNGSDLNCHHRNENNNA